MRHEKQDRHGVPVCSCGWVPKGLPIPGLMQMEVDKHIADAPVEDRHTDPISAHARSSDPATSHEAAASIESDKIRASQRAVLTVLRDHGPMHDQALIDAYAVLQYPENLPKQSPSGIRTRRSELAAKGKVLDTGEKVVLPSGRRSMVWKAAGRDV